MTNAVMPCSRTLPPTCIVNMYKIYRPDTCPFYPIHERRCAKRYEQRGLLNEHLDNVEHPLDPRHHLRHLDHQCRHHNCWSHHHNCCSQYSPHMRDLPHLRLPLLREALIALLQSQFHYLR